MVGHTPGHRWCRHTERESRRVRCRLLRLIAHSPSRILVRQILELMAVLEALAQLPCLCTFRSLFAMRAIAVSDPVLRRREAWLRLGRT